MNLTSEFGKLAKQVRRMRSEPGERRMNSQIPVNFFFSYEQTFFVFTEFFILWIFSTKIFIYLIHMFVKFWKISSEKFFLLFFKGMEKARSAIIYFWGNNKNNGADGRSIWARGFLRSKKPVCLPLLFLLLTTANLFPIQTKEKIVINIGLKGSFFSLVEWGFPSTKSELESRTEQSRRKNLGEWGVSLANDEWTL